MLARKPSPAGAASGAPARYDRAALLTGALLIVTAAVSWLALIRQENMWDHGERGRAHPSMTGAMTGGHDAAERHATHLPLCSDPAPLAA